VIASDVVEVDVDALGRRLAQQIDDGPIVVVERRVEAELVEQESDLCFGPCAPDHAVAAELGNLRREASDSARGRRHPDDVSVAQLGRVDQPGIRGHAHRAERPEVRLSRRNRCVDHGKRCDARERRLTGGDDGVVAPALRMPDGVARDEPVGARFDHLADGPDVIHRGIERERVEVARRPALPQSQPHPWIDRSKGVAHQDLAGPRLRNVDLDGDEVVGRDLAPRVLDEVDLMGSIEVHMRLRYRRTL